MDKDNKNDPKIAQRDALIENYKKMVGQAREDIAREDRQLVAEILKKADGVLKAVAKEKKFTIILKDPNAIGYLDESVDITTQVLAGLNK
ncbi:MAG: OmpH family outer membrane protein [Proteobacteria bacterium]|nr:OmpH family outer membrane protein [Pseudomonadota bacterium]MBU1387587.1 OmpH family outer membrane protein [Pseudomonadota bacterium]MBU1545078.1 OmpH family outer membrane protein [Pseudomonadota bacterium]MBU2482530.1 OmpH family outer membrane protein [Pseudomonadota bacterium]